jgi:hypothetical protein
MEVVVYHFKLLIAYRTKKTMNLQLRTMSKYLIRIYLRYCMFLYKTGEIKEIQEKPQWE